MSTKLIPIMQEEAARLMDELITPIPEIFHRPIKEIPNSISVGDPGDGFESHARNCMQKIDLLSEQILSLPDIGRNVITTPA